MAAAVRCPHTARCAAGAGVQQQQQEKKKASVGSSVVCVRVFPPVWLARLDAEAGPASCAVCAACPAPRVSARVCGLGGVHAHALFARASVCCVYVCVVTEKWRGAVEALAGWCRVCTRACGRPRCLGVSVPGCCVQVWCVLRCACLSKA